MTKFFYLLEGIAERCVAEFWLNGIPIMRRGVDGGESFGVQVNHLLVEGQNMLEITLHPGPVPSLSRWGEFGPRAFQAAQPGQRASLALCRYPFGATVGGPEREELHRLEWKPGPGESREIAFTMRSRVDLGKVAPRWKWQDAPVLKLDAGDRMELTEFLDDLGASIQRGDPESFLALSDVRIEEISAAYETDPAERRWVVERGIFVDSGADGFQVAPLDPRLFDFRLCAEGRMVELIAIDWQPILRAGPDRQGNYGFYDMFLSKLDGNWKIVR